MSSYLWFPINMKETFSQRRQDETDETKNFWRVSHPTTMESTLGRALITSAALHMSSLWKSAAGTVVPWVPIAVSPGSPKPFGQWHGSLGVRK